MSGTALSAFDARNMRWIDFVSSRKRGLRQSASAYLGNLFVRKPAVPMIKAARIALLRNHVALIIRYRSNTEVRRVDARRVVANVHEYFAFRNWPNEKSVNVAMRLRSLSALTSSTRDNPITVHGVIASPKPASSCFLDAGFNRHPRNHWLVFGERSKAAFLHIAILAKVAAESLRIAQQTLLFTLFHGEPPNGQAMTLP